MSKNPLPQTLPKECAKAVKILESFVTKANNGLDDVIPRRVLERACGFAIFTVIRAGLLISSHGGSGIVIARLDNGSWSAPSAIGLTGVGLGIHAVAEVTDFLIVLNTPSAVKAFMARGSLTIGGNVIVAIGPLGRTGEASGALNSDGKVAAMFSYSKSRGLFGGTSAEGSVIVEREVGNTLAYHSNVRAAQILSGAVTPPDWAQPLIRTLESCASPPAPVEDSVPIIPPRIPGTDPNIAVDDIIAQLLHEIALTSRGGADLAITLFDFRAVKPGDLSFLKGQVIAITEKGGTWWKGKLHGQEGSFPANFVKVV